MAKITTRAELNIGVELILDEPNRTIELAVAGNLVAKDGATWQAVYSKLVDLWATSTYQDSPFPMNAIDAESGQYQIGIDAGGNANGWRWLNDTVRSYLRDGGAEEYNATGGLGRIYVSAIGLGSVNSGSQLYYQTVDGGTATNFTYDDQCNEMIQVFGDSAEDAGTTDFDTRTFFKAYVREEAKKYSDSILVDTGKTSTGAIIRNFLLSNEDDLKITDVDANVSSLAKFTGIGIEYFAANQTRSIGGTNRNFKRIINGNNQSLEDIYTRVQFQLRQSGDIDDGAGTINGNTADLLLNFVGDELQTTTSVYIDNILPTDSNRIVFKDDGGINRINPFESAGIMNFNAVMVDGSDSSYRLMYTAPVGALNDYGESGAITVNDASGAPITGTISATTLAFTFDYDNDAVGGAAGTDKAVTLIGINPNGSKFAVGTGVLTKSKAISLSVVGETDRAYL